MKTVTWIACGIGLNIAAAALHGGNAPDAILSSGAAGTVPKLLLVGAGNICIWRGLRSALGDLWSGLTGRKVRENAGRGRIADDVEPVSDFDADEAFERYMQQRKARELEPERVAQTVHTPRTSIRAPVRGGFGRRVI